jgi:hypothetical protein
LSGCTGYNDNSDPGGLKGTPLGCANYNSDTDNSVAVGDGTGDPCELMSGDVIGPFGVPMFYNYPAPDEGAADRPDVQTDYGGGEYGFVMGMMHRIGSNMPVFDPGQSEVAENGHVDGVLADMGDSQDWMDAISFDNVDLLPWD